MVEAATAGSLALWGAIGASGLTLFAPRRHAIRLLRLAVALTIAATAVLAFALVSGDFTLAYVVETTSRATPWPYRVAALWGAMEGSLLFFATLILIIGAAGTRGRGRVERGVIATIGFGLLLLTALSSNPFERLDVPAVDGQGLLAILQHPAMIYHPPILYLGLTTLIVPFALTVGAVRGRATDRLWSKAARHWLTWSWVLLTLGMVAGANWAYIELGWGGFWAWDPVENTSLMPWLAITVFLHTSRVTERDGRLRRWTVFFSMFPFALSVLGVYLTRSGVTGSIHAFAEDPVIGRILLTAAVVTTLLVTSLTFRVPTGEPWGEPRAGRDTWLLVNGGLVAMAMVFVLAGSAYPAYVQVFSDRTVVVDSGFFVTTALPLALIIATLIGFALNTTWSRSGLRWVDLALFMAAMGAATLMASTLAQGPPVIAVVLTALAAGALALLARDLLKPTRRHLVPARLAHLGMAMVLIGAGGSAMGADFAGSVRVGETVTVGSHLVELISIDTGEGDRYVYAEGVFKVDDSSLLRPQIRAYEDQRLPVAEPAMRSTPVSDLIIAVSVLSPDLESFEVSVFVRPMVWWVWIGSLVIALAGASALFSTVGAGGGRRRVARAWRRPAGTTTGRTGR